MADQSADSSAAATREALRDAKRDLLARLMAEEGLHADPAAIGRRADSSRAPLSHAQEVVWLLDRATPGLIAYNSALAYRLRGPVDDAAMQHALDALVARHDSLRTRFTAQGSTAIQEVDAAGAAHFAVEDLRGVPAVNREEQAALRMRELSRRPFNIEEEHLFRATLVRIADNESLLLLLTHHIVSDAWSYGVLTRELSSLYAAAATQRNAALPDGAIQFGDFAAWEREQLVGERLSEKLSYWRGNLLPIAPDLVVPTDRPRSAMRGFEGGRALLLLDRALLDQLKSLAASQQATLYMVLLAAFQTVLHRWSGQDDLVTGSAIAGRNRSETENVIGYFSAAVPLRTRFAEDDTFSSLLSRVRTTVLGALEHQDTPADAMLHELAAQGRAGHAPLFQNVLTMQETAGAGLALPGIVVEPYEVLSGTTKFELTLLPSERAEGLELLLWYRSDLFDAATADRLLHHISSLLHSVAQNSAMPLADIQLLSSQELAALAEWNATTKVFPIEADIAAVIQAAGQSRPAQPCIVCGDHSITWDEFLTRGNQLAHHLQALGAGPDVPVGLCLERSIKLIVGMYGILAAGAAYVPLMPSLPAARLAQQLAESGAEIVVTTEKHVALLPVTTRNVLLDVDEAELNVLPASSPRSAVQPAQLAYVLFTSGSTGVPKGVAVTRANVMHYTQSIADVLGLDLRGEGTPWHCATVSTLGADLGNTSVFAALASGGTLHVLPEELLMNAASFQSYIKTHPVDLLKITPSHLQALLGADARAEYLPKRWLVLGGEACPWTLVEQVRAVSECRILNHYGPTETTVGACTFEVGGHDVQAWAPATVPIGLPLPNGTAHVFDRAGQLVSVGIPGELWIGGAGVARGYLHRDIATEERFVTRNGERLYRTGDRVRRLPSGDLEFLGRVDDQVKIRGHRVEPGEIEAVLMEHEAVRQAVVVLHAEQLVAYAVYSRPIDDTALAAHVAARLPDYMVPAVFVALDTFPLNANGKVDKRALPSVARAPITMSAAEPQNETERTLAGIWRDVLKKETVGTDDNFFALGGHSLLAIRLLGRIAKEFGKRLTLRTLFENATIRSLAQVLAPTNVEEGAGT